MVTLAFGAMVPSYEALVAVTAPEAGAYVAPQPLVTVCPAGRVKPNCQPLTGLEPVLVMVTDAVRPVFQALVVTVTLQGPVAGGGVVPPPVRPKKVRTRAPMP